MKQNFNCVSSLFFTDWSFNASDTLNLHICAAIYTTTSEWVWFSKDKKIKRQCALLLAQKNYGQCQGFIHFGNVDHLLLRITLIRRKLLSVSSSIRSLSLLPFRKWLVVFQRWRSLIHFICPFLSLFCFFYVSWRYQGQAIHLSRSVIWIRSNVVSILLGLIIYVLSGLKILRTEKGFGSGTPLCIQTDQTPFLKSNTNFVREAFK